MGSALLNPRCRLRIQIRQQKLQRIERQCKPHRPKCAARFHLPDVPTAKEAGLPGMVMTFWVNFAAPAGTPRTIVDQLNREVIAALAKPATMKRLSDLGLDPVGSTPEQSTKLLDSEIQRWSAVIKASNIKAD